MGGIGACIGTMGCQPPEGGPLGQQQESILQQPPPSIRLRGLQAPHNNGTKKDAMRLRDTMKQSFFIEKRKIYTLVDNHFKKHIFILDAPRARPCA